MFGSGRIPFGTECGLSVSKLTCTLRLVVVAFCGGRGVA